jgi:hypothetical protein
MSRYRWAISTVWEIETWLLLFPEAVTSFAKGWRVPAKRSGPDTGRFQDPKRIFKDEISNSGARYRESDAPAIASHIVALAQQSAPVGTNRSHEGFRTDAAGRCRDLNLPTP